MCAILALAVAHASALLYAVTAAPPVTGVVDPTGEYSWRFGKTQAAVSVLRAQGDAFFRLVADVDGRACICEAAAKEDQKGAYVFAASAPFERAVVDKGFLSIIPRGRGCCARVSRGEIRLELSARSRVKSCMVSARKSYFHDIRSQKRRGAYVVSGDKVEAVYGVKEWMVARFSAARNQTMGLLRPLDVDCREQPEGRSSILGNLSYRMHGSFGPLRGSAEACEEERTLSCSGEAVLFGCESAASQKGSARSCVVWQGRGLSCEGSESADVFASGPLLPRMCPGEKGWTLPEYDDCKVVKIDELEGAIRGLLVKCVWQHPVQCYGEAIYQLGAGAAE